MATFNESKAEWERRDQERKALLKAQEEKEPGSARPEVWQSSWIAIDAVETGTGGGNWLVAKSELPLDEAQRKRHAKGHLDIVLIFRA